MFRFSNMVVVFSILLLFQGMAGVQGQTCVVDSNPCPTGYNCCGPFFVEIGDSTSTPVGSCVLETEPCPL
ncbi:hypothetical protein BT96DRAFT_982784 [Gymnopus androsaceus JB14]|uniref:Uncharacterized protein n=1 Tax=Gymnopus androsaceus JB14 TaxID=1447944 RepID=A0A6A4GBL2_9AGAR|nr:hypothetical protein BT96DRAFT_982784 [Gymnopus androsaceus JB14]